MNASANATSKAAQGTEDLAQQIENLRNDLARLAAGLSSDLSDSMEKAGRQIDRTGRTARDNATAAVVENPMMALGIAVGVGLLLGLIARKG